MSEPLLTDQWPLFLGTAFIKQHFDTVDWASGLKNLLHEPQLIDTQKAPPCVETRHNDV